MGTRRHRLTAQAARIRRHRRVRKRVTGTPDRPRLAVFRSNSHIYGQLIDDEAGQTVAAASDLEADLRTGAGEKSARAAAVGTRLAERARGAGVTQVVFDRAGYRFHGRVKALADAARAAGLEF